MLTVIHHPFSPLVMITGPYLSIPQIYDISTFLLAKFCFAQLSLIRILLLIRWKEKSRFSWISSLKVIQSQRTFVLFELRFCKSLGAFCYPSGLGNQIAQAPITGSVSVQIRLFMNQLSLLLRSDTKLNADQYAHWLGPRSIRGALKTTIYDT